MTTFYTRNEVQYLIDAKEAEKRKLDREITELRSSQTYDHPNSQTKQRWDYQQS